MKTNRFAMALIMGASLLWACNNDSDADNNVNNMDDNAMNDTATTANMGMTSDDGRDFVMEAASGGMMEVELGQMAQQKGSNAKVKDFGAMMVKDHTAANDELKSIAASKNIELPASLKDKHAEHVKEVGEKSGKEFDEEYMELMAEDHEEDVEKFEKAANNLTDPELKAFAAKTLPVLRKHLEEAKSINSSMK